ncbi:MAG TPA: phosphoglucosamine mutase [Candidatus Ratteibacteria bacterium]|nr:phosphoglucosamine mutase [Candidatus Ratteibacteria bacterium]HRV03642.1 phosphoglucosamine mutase [Candidatus Ratteibacteria bacterium]
MEQLIVSVSGIRGIYGKDLKEEDALMFGKAFGLWAKGQNIAVARDTRLSGEPLKAAFISGLLWAGKNVSDFGIAATPALTWFAEKTGGFYGSIITASHNPVEYNGIKLINSCGTFLNLKQFESFFNTYKNIEKKKSKKPGVYFFDAHLMDRFFSSLFNFIDVSSIRKKRIKVVVDPVEGVGAIYSKKFLEMLGCDVVMINSTLPGIFSHPPEPVPSHLRHLGEIVKKENADIGFGQDPDCDRLLLVADNGMCVSEDLGFSVLINWILQRKKGPVVVNIATTKLVDDICRDAGVEIFRTMVGEVCVVEKMKEVGASAGGEGNGGVIFPDFHYGRDSFIGMALALEMLAKTGLNLSEIIKKFPQYYFVKKKIKFPSEKISGLYKKLKEKFTDGRIKHLDGIRIDFEDAWLGIRPSGTEPIVRIFVEGKDTKTVNSLIKEVQECINSFYKTV